MQNILIIMRRGKNRSNVKPVLLILSSLFFFIEGASQDQTQVSHTLFLIGDCGEHYLDEDPMQTVLKGEMNLAGPRTTLIYLGDNIYPKGMPEKGHRLRKQSEQIMQYQIEWLPATGAKGIFIPGNHDWDHWGRSGYDFLMNQQHWIDSLNNDYVQMLPRDGCPGPVKISLDSNATLVILDTQWPLHRWRKPGKESACNAKTTEELLAGLAEILDRDKDKRIIIAGHHPLITYGEHGGVFTWKAHLFPLTELSHWLYIPLPGIGSLYPLWRKWFGHKQDTQHPVYRRFSNNIQSIMKKHPGSLYVAGHEHALQHIVKDSTHFIVSGSGSKTEYVRKKGYALFADDVRGFTKVQILTNGDLVIDFIKADRFARKGEVIYHTRIPGKLVRRR